MFPLFRRDFIHQPPNQASFKEVVGGSLGGGSGVGRGGWRAPGGKSWGIVFLIIFIGVWGLSENQANQSVANPLEKNGSNFWLAPVDQLFKKKRSGAKPHPPTTPVEPH